MATPVGLPRHLTRLAVTITAAGDLHLRLHVANRITWFVGESTIASQQRTVELMVTWATKARTAVENTSPPRSAATILSVPSERGAPVLWDPSPELDQQFTAAFVDKAPSAQAGRTFGESLGQRLADFFGRSQDAARALLDQGWAETAEARLTELRTVVDPSQQRGAGTIAARLGSDLRAVGFLALAPTERIRRLYQELDHERRSLDNWEQALSRLGLQARRGSGDYP